MLFGDVPIGTEELVSELNRRASETARLLDPLDRNTAWTTAVKKALAEMATQRNLTPYYSDPDGGKSEFLLDLVWWEQNATGRRAALGVECEWGNPFDNDPQRRANAVVDDFEKLLQFKAPLKLMIFYAKNAEMRRRIHEGLQEYLRSFAQHVSGECYVFVEFAAHCYSYKCDIEKDGRDENLRIVPLDDSSTSILS